MSIIDVVRPDGVYKSICRVCHGGCGALVHMEGGRAVKVTGDPGAPVSRGWMCIKGLKSHEIAGHRDRLTQPLRRTGARGEGKWEPIGWDRALQEISDRLGAIIKGTGAESIAIGQGTGRHHYMHVVRFANALGTPNWYEPGLAQCFIPRITVSNFTYGGFVTADYEGEASPACIIFWAHNPTITSPDGELGIAAKRAIGRARRAIAIDPRRSETGRLCDTWLPIRPGTDAALALAMIHVIIERGLYDSEFVAEWCKGFDELKAHVICFTPAWASSITGIDEGAIVDAATAYATIKPAVIDWGLGLEQNVNTLQTVRAIAILRGLTGNIDVPGGDILGMNILRAYPVMKDKLPPEASKRRLGAEEFKLLGGWRAYMPSAHIPALYRAMDEGEPYRIRGLMLFGNNPLLTVADSRGVHRALGKLDLLVATDLFMTPSAAMADYVLPAAFWLEFEHLMGFPLVVENMARAHPALAEPPGECRRDEWIMDELMRRMGLPGAEMTYREIFDHQLGPLGVTFDELLKIGTIHPPHVYHKYREGGFRTPSKKVELSSGHLKRLGYDALPSYVEPPESPVSKPKLLGEFPYILITGARRKEFFHSEHRQVEGLRSRRPDPMADMHPVVARREGISDGAWVRLATPRGEIAVRANVTEDIRPDVVSVDHGWWYPEREGFGLFESNANVLTDAGPPYDPGFGSYKLRGLLCSVKPFE